MATTKSIYGDKTTDNNFGANRDTIRTPPVSREQSELWMYKLKYRPPFTTANSALFEWELRDLLNAITNN